MSCRSFELELASLPVTLFSSPPSSFFSVALSNVFSENIGIFFYSIRITKVTFAFISSNFSRDPISLLAGDRDCVRYIRDSTAEFGVRAWLGVLARPSGIRARGATKTGFWEICLPPMIGVISFWVACRERCPGDRGSRGFPDFRS